MNNLYRWELQRRVEGDFVPNKWQHLRDEVWLVVGSFPTRSGAVYSFERNTKLMAHEFRVVKYTYSVTNSEVL